MYIYLDLKLMLLKLMFPASPAVRYTDLVPTFEKSNDIEIQASVGYLQAWAVEHNELKHIFGYKFN